MKIWSVFLLVVGLMILGSSNQAIGVVDDYLIVPGERIGVVALSRSTLSTWPDVYSAHRVHPNWQKRGQVETMCWSSIRICATFLLRGSAVVHTAILVNTTNPRYRTKEGVRVGTAYRTARRLLGTPTIYESYSAGSVAEWSGLEVEIRGGRIITIAVVH